jgi:hypothetical protein
LSSTVPSITEKNWIWLIRKRRLRSRPKLVKRPGWCRVGGGAGCWQQLKTIPLCRPSENSPVFHVWQGLRTRCP